MKRLALCLAALMLVPFAFACSDDDDGKYSVSAENACNYLVPKGGTNDFEIEFDAEDASTEAIAQAKKLCVEEMNGLPKCKDAIIAEYSCEYAYDQKKLSDAEYIKAWSKCGEDKKCMDEAFKYYPCYDVIIASEECIRGLSEEDLSALENYKEGYRSKYPE